MAKDMTKGNITSQLIRFTIPLILGNLFQLTYNAADSVIVGKFLGDGALAAVGTAGPVMNLIILFFSGMCMGAGIIMSTMFGAKDYEQLEKQISTSPWRPCCIYFHFFIYVFICYSHFAINESSCCGPSWSLRISPHYICRTYFYIYLQLLIQYASCTWR